MLELIDACTLPDVRGVVQLIEGCVAQLVDVRVVLDVRLSLQPFERLLVVGELGLAEQSVDRNCGPLSSHFLIGINF